MYFVCCLDDQQFCKIARAKSTTQSFPLSLYSENEIELIQFLAHLNRGFK